MSVITIVPFQDPKQRLASNEFELLYIFMSITQASAVRDFSSIALSRAS
jgi:hypothetical protein